MRPTTPRVAAVLLAAVCGLAGCGSEGAARSAGSSSSPSSSSTSTSPSPDPAPAPEGDLEQQVTTALDGLDRRARIAQLFVVGVPADQPDRGAELAGQGVGGTFLAGRPRASADELARLTAGWQERSTGPELWIAVDQEGGSVQSLQGPGFDRLPPATEQGDLPADELTALAGTLGDQLAGAGVNLNLAPVVDVVPAGTESANGPIGSFDRQYGATAAEVVPAATAIVDGLAGAGVTSTLKHFPGLGRVRGNTDDTPDVVDAETAAGDDSVAAFAGTLAGTAAADPMVMLSSATYARIDPANRAAFSPVVARDVLRGELGFTGPVISDDLGAATAVADVPVGERAVRFLGAGGTLVLTVDPATFPAMLDAVVARDAADAAFAAAVDDAVRTALLAKARAGLLD
ncbi:glycoside hydrolase family 3 protein [Blastococcus sp. TF02-09]|uniref:glycoside hydrolase family 3 N-terminal domain-containing protein n=1 Tax=Blastococcus sp. TF02-09 TaxID=2250576 RepID=UPI000DE9D2C4|nr:glycoside hydrolase family 3 N-terminal domain-containing protein [Blastococcus sp. TF02-9]RBY81182.1 glycoside hydrolase family 3 protein [Blastococcus sp. TF02-9]